MKNQVSQEPTTNKAEIIITQEDKAATTNKEATDLVTIITEAVKVETTKVETVVATITVVAKVEIVEATIEADKE